MSERLPFITGSHAYGTPKSQSDIDLVVFADEATGLNLKLNAEGRSRHYDNCLRYGKLNIILANAHDYDLWKIGTDKLKTLGRPVTDKKEAIAVFRELGITQCDSNMSAYYPDFEFNAVSNCIAPTVIPNTN